MWKTLNDEWRYVTPWKTGLLQRLKKVTWEKLHKNLLQKLDQQLTGLLLIFSQLASFYNVMHLCIHLGKEDDSKTLVACIFCKCEI